MAEDGCGIVSVLSVYMFYQRFLALLNYVFRGSP